tara:strand:+ start:363 stop:1082 length:720 start_codon:yes stop_codon:yes gene_type:complete
MARISTYANDTTVSTTDRFLGSNADGTVKNFRMSDVSTYLRATNSAGVGGQLVYVYNDATSSPSGDRKPGTITFDAGGAAIVAFSGITTIKVSKYPNGTSNSAVTLINTLLNTNVIISDTEDQDQLGVYSITAITQDSDETDFYDLSLTLVGSLSNGNLQNLRSYSISAFTAGDKNHVSSQLNFSAGVSQTITHNLGKFPSVTVVSSNGNEVVGDIQHTSINTLKVTFENNFAAKVYVN